MRIESTVKVGTKIRIFVPSSMHSDLDFTDRTTATDVLRRIETTMVDDNSREVDVFQKPCTRNELTTRTRN
jgi:hypothetical protein